MGDAAFVARPHVGLGVTKAAGDAADFGRCAAAHADDFAAALRTYAASQRLHSEDRSSRMRGRSVSPSARRRQQVPQAELIAHLRRPEVVMREIAVPDWAERSVALGRLQVT